MELTTRFGANAFIEIKCDTMEETVYYQNEKEINDLAMNLLSVVDDLARLSQKSFTQLIDESGMYVPVED